MKVRLYVAGFNIALSSDEITKIEKNYIGRNRHHRSFKITGKILAGLTEKEIQESDTILMASKIKNNETINELTREILKESFSEYEVMNIEKNMEEKIYEHNRYNLKKIIEWSKSNIENCYQKIIIETIAEEEAPLLLTIPLVFVKKLNFFVSIEDGIGRFELTLYQKLNFDKNIEEAYIVEE
ncbi:MULTISPECIES: hypothetical protein [Fusobacterium]|uniref:hypothetical protein n=1 Tax=Fusobacterium TaxID=848 RepID=UPI0008A5FC83|nr:MULTISPECIES: hypothetical protein [Fusobacterium]OFL91667.1 hypothetical protein HMPREF2747_07320 [Fusobacterium sp. HMSC073F01]